MFYTGRLLILFVVVLFLFILPTQGARIAPRIFDYAVLQYAFASVAAVLTSIGLFLSLRGILLSRSRIVISPFFAFLLYFALVLFTYGEALRRSYETREVANEIVSSSTLPKYLRDLQRAEKPRDREVVAMMIYQLHGLPVSYEVEKGRSVLYKPTERDVEEWMKLKPIMQKGVQTVVTIDVTILQYQTLIGIYAAMLFMVFAIGSIWITVTKPSPAREDI